MSKQNHTPHDHAIAHVTGQAIYIDDRPMLPREVIVEIVGSPVSSGRLLSVHAEEALKLPGVLAVFQARDLAVNKFGAIVVDQPLLVESEIGYIDEPICLIVGTDRRILGKAKKLIRFEIQESPAIHSLDEAIEKNHVLYTASTLRRGHCDDVIARSPHQLKGVFESGGQEHFYLESQAAIAYPMEDGQVEIHSSTQHPTETQHLVAKALGLSYAEVVCIVKRMGGGFGGKESQAAPFAVYAALVAHKMKRPARVAISKDDDMRITGKRHPFKTHYHVGFDQDGKICGIKMKLFADAGAYVDLSPSILDRALFHADGCYYLENVLLEGQAIKTNTHSNTAFRGFGGPQGNMVIETVLEEMAVYLKKDPLAVRKINLYSRYDRNLTPYGQEVRDYLLPDIFDQLERTSDYQNRRKEIDLFNKNQKNKKIMTFVLGSKKYYLFFALV